MQSSKFGPLRHPFCALLCHTIVLSAILRARTARRDRNSWLRILHAVAATLQKNCNRADTPRAEGSAVTRKRPASRLPSRSRIEANAQPMSRAAIALEPEAPYWLGGAVEVTPHVTEALATGGAVSPFLALDYAPSRKREGPRRSYGVDTHPVRGFEVVTLCLEGEARDAGGPIRGRRALADCGPGRAR